MIAHLKVISMPLERIERLEDLGRVHFTSDYRSEFLEGKENDRPLHNDEQPEKSDGTEGM